MRTCFIAVVEFRGLDLLLLASNLSALTSQSTVVLEKLSHSALVILYNRPILKYVISFICAITLEPALKLMRRTHTVTVEI
jgi:hypothetical protein